MSASMLNRLLLSTPLVKIMPISYLLKITTKKIILPFYHAVNDVAPPHLLYLYDTKRVEEFSSDLDFLLKHFKPVGLKDIIDSCSQGKVLPQTSFHLTFDDGLSEFNDVIAPVLLKKGVPATCFLNEKFLENKDLFFKFKASLLIDNLHHQQMGSQAWKHFHEWCTENNLPKTYYKDLILSLTYDKKELLDELAAKTDINFSEYLLKHKPYLEKKQVDKLVSQGFTFGSQGMATNGYRSLEEESILRHTKESINSICNTFGLNYRVFSFPVNGYELKSTLLDKIFSEKIADVTFGGMGAGKQLHTSHLQRFSAYPKNLGIENVIKNELH
jgi:peptidoglycan/xylan/chitin deacetylase (PgdA/CDA1 family)